MAAVTTTCTHCNAKLRLHNPRLIGAEIRCPRCKAKFIAHQVESLTTQSGSPESGQQNPTENLDAGFANIQVYPEDQHVRLRFRTRQKRHQKQWRWLTIALSLCFIALISGFLTWPFAFPEHQSSPQPPAAHKAVRSKLNKTSSASVPINDTISPTAGAAISMDYIPVVPQFVFHFRPAEIWAGKEAELELVATLGNLGTWLHDFILQTTRFGPTEIEELTIAINFGARTNTSDLAVVARLVHEQRESQLIGERIRGRLIPDLDAEVYESDNLAFTIVNSKTVAISSLEIASELADARTYAAVPQPEIETLLEQSDHRRHATLITDLQVFDAHKDLVLIEPLHRLAESTLLWIGTDCRFVSWSVHLQPHLYMQTTLIPTAELSTNKLERRILDQFSSLPEHLQTLAQTMRPATVGHRHLIGRFPAMMQAFVWGTQISRLNAGATLTTVLPRKAAANLTAGAMLTWNESIRTPSNHAELEKPTEFQSVANRLQTSLLIDFRREPLQEVLAYIGREIGISTSIDGDALKRAGLTQNMQQTHNLGNITAVAALDVILHQYKGILVIVVDETKQTILLTTQSAAVARQLTIFDTTSNSPL